MGDEHKTVLLSILATLSTAVLILLITVGVNGGFSFALFKAYVLPLILSAVTLTIFFSLLLARHRGKLPFFVEEPTPMGKATTETPRSGPDSTEST